MIFLSHESALEFWRTQRTRNLPNRKRRAVAWNASGKTSEGIRPVWSDIKNLPYGIHEPVHVLVPNAQSRSRSKHFVCHVCGGEIPRGSFLEVSANLAVASPSLCFAQCAQKLSIPQIAKLGLEFCGAYRLAEENYLDGQPLVQRVALNSYVREYGPSHAKSAMYWVSDGSASPRETMMVLMLCLPPKYGGYGLPTPTINAHIDIGTRMRRDVSKNYFKCDLFWPDKKLDAEYDSDLHHTGADRIAEDAQRRNSLEHLGITVITITNGQVYNLVALDRSARHIAKRLDYRVRPRCGDWRKRQIRLRRMLQEF